MRKYLGVIFLVALAWGLLGSSHALAADNGELIQGVKDSKVYYMEGSLKRWVADRATFDAWGFNPNAIRRVSMAELNGQPTGPNLTRLIDYGGNVYYVIGGQYKYVPNFDVLAYYNMDARSLVFLNTDTFNRLSDGGTLTAPSAIRLSKDNNVYLIENGQRRPFASDTVLSAWGISRNDAPVVDSLRRLPVGQRITRLINNNGAVFYVGNGQRYWIPSEDAILYNSISWSDLVSVSDTSAQLLPEGGPLGIPALVKSSGDSRIWLTDDNGVRRLVPDLDILYNLGYSLNQVTTVPQSTINHFPEGTVITRFILDLDGNYYFIINGQRRKFNGTDPVMRRLLGLPLDALRILGRVGISHIAPGPDMPGGLSNLEGYDIPATSGKVGREQHLYINTAEADLGRTDASAALHYSDTGTPLAAQNGMAGGYGSFGSASSPATAAQEQYYINMRWNYCQWRESSTQLDSFGRAATICTSLDYTAKNWHRHKKVLVTNPANGKMIIASVEESGPAFWTGRVSGLSPEAMLALGASTDNTLTYLWVFDQGLSLGPLN